MEIRHKERARLVASFFFDLSVFVASVPKEYICNIGCFLGTLAYIADRRHRLIIRRNLQFIYPEWSKNRIRKFTKLVFQSMGITVMEISQATCFSRKDVLHRTRIKGKEYLLNAIKNPKGVIIISGHLGNWEICHLLLVCYLQMPITLVARKIRPEFLDRATHKFRTHFGNVVVYKKRALSQMARTLNQGKALGLLIDQETKHSKGVEVTFFGRTVIATPAAALLARRYNSSVLPVFCVRERDGRLTLIVEPPLTLKKTEDSAADLKTNTQIMTSAIEKVIKAYPEQWFWFHKRWKGRHPYLYEEDLAKRQQRRQKRKARSRKVAKSNTL
ncbi:MAG: lysophospholipid acyltransferase family protein [Deltaproteobacteria bacterium]|nr:lysophospholipid acyltransferase family protein [Deltaproteobacteria bacterium]